jgi:hypothetical protein
MIKKFLLLLLFSTLLTGCQLFNDKDKEQASESTEPQETPTLIGYKINQYKNSNVLIASDFVPLGGVDLQEINQSIETDLERSDYLYIIGVALKDKDGKREHQSELNYHVDSDRDFVCYVVSWMNLYKDGHLEEIESKNSTCGTGIASFTETIISNETWDEVVKINFINNDLLERYTVVQYDEHHEKIAEEDFHFSPDSVKEHTFILKEACVDYKIIETYRYSAIRPHHTRPGEIYTIRKIFERVENTMSIHALDQDDNRVLYTFKFELENNDN